MYKSMKTVLRLSSVYEFVQGHHFGDLICYLIIDTLYQL